MLRECLLQDLVNCHVPKKWLKSDCRKLKANSVFPIDLQPVSKAFTFCILFKTSEDLHFRYLKLQYHIFLISKFKDKTT